MQAILLFLNLYVLALLKRKVERENTPLRYYFCRVKFKGGGRGRGWCFVYRGFGFGAGLQTQKTNLTIQRSDLLAVLTQPGKYVQKVFCA